MDQPLNILIVDDEPKNLTVLEAVLTDTSYRVIRAQSAEQALLALLSEDFALIILDIRMPGMTGFELASIIKQRKKTARVPIIFLTAYFNEDSHVIEGYGTGAVDYLLKPVSPSILRSKVAVFAELYRTQRETERANLELAAQVTERVRVQEQLQRLIDTLEGHVRERTDAIEQLRRSEARQKELLAQSQAMQIQLTQLSGQVLQAQEDERRRISGELNELTAHTLSGIGESLESLKADAGAGAVDLEIKIANAQRLAQKAAETVRRFAGDLRPSTLDDQGLITSLRTYLKEFTGRTGIGTQLTAAPEVEKLGSALCIALYRVAQEALTNVARHARASRVDVIIQQVEGGLSMEIKDDGQGFEAGAAATGSNHHLGLLGMRARVELVGGKFAIDSAPGEPTTLRVMIPPVPPERSRGT